MPRFILLILTISFSISLYSQKAYKTTGGEMIFSRTINNSPFTNSTSRTRVSAFFHFNSNYHYDFSPALGCFSGFSISNIGFNYESSDTLFKRRSYSLGIPIALKFGNMIEGKYLFIGGEIEFPIHYKQKKIFDDQKYKYSSFFDKRSNTILPSVFGGIQFPDGISIKLRIYLRNFLNSNFSGKDFGIITDYKNLDTKLIMISLSYNLKHNKIKKIIKNDNNRYASLNI